MKICEPATAMEAIKARLHTVPLKPPYKANCYVAAEGLYYLLGGKAAGYKPMNMKHEGSQHWWLQGPGGEVLDPTVEQFQTPVPYSKGRGRGFLTKHPSKRTLNLLLAISLMWTQQILGRV